MVQMLGIAPQDSSRSTHGYSHAEYGVSSFDPYVPRPADRGEANERGDDDDDGGDDDDQDEGSRNKRPDVAREVPILTQKRKKGGPVHLEHIPPYGEHDRGSLKCRSHYMALTGWDLTDAHAWIYLYFPMFALPVRLRIENENKLLDIRLRLDMMTTDEVRWLPYRTQEIQVCWVSTRHGFIAYFDYVELYMPDRILG
ncbi:hypothetical protein M9H77_31325 [Catharanthus roseus]|uniref:Uncharacterized protein n=1 Tax=Catharanthus roseus TaxID=4058 RepID=A0ACC0A237_CATRO|nr:hypothetical protein M9H77_31325 [Catharanthus roseus]